MQIMKNINSFFVSLFNVDNMSEQFVHEKFVAEKKLNKEKKEWLKNENDICFAD